MPSNLQYEYSSKGLSFPSEAVKELTGTHCATTVGEWLLLLDTKHAGSAVELVTSDTRITAMLAKGRNSQLILGWFNKSTSKGTVICRRVKTEGYEVERRRTSI